MTTMTCPRCDGTGKIPEFGHVASGVCFRCCGSGKIVEADYRPDPEFAVMLLNRHTSSYDYVYRVKAPSSAQARRYAQKAYVVDPHWSKYYHIEGALVVRADEIDCWADEPGIRRAQGIRVDDTPSEK